MTRTYTSCLRVVGIEIVGGKLWFQPATRWDAFKLGVFPDWALIRWPVRWDARLVGGEGYYIPKIGRRGEGRYVEGLEVGETSP